MTHPTTPSASDALQKARELAELEKKQLKDWFTDYDSDIDSPDGLIATCHDSDDHAPFIVALRNAFPSIHAELERVTAERDAALKGYRGMRSGLEEFAKLEPVNRDGEFDYESSNYDDECRKAVYFAERHVSVRAQNLLTSFPEIK